jgi:hypothetical protein
MFDFDPDEWLFFGLAFFMALAGGWNYACSFLRASQFHSSRPVRRLLIGAPVAGLLLTCVVLQIWSDAKVRGHLDYELLFLVGAAAWLTVANFAIGIFGISSRDDAIERSNLSAAVVVSAWLLGTAIIYALSNVGGGPTIWTTLAGMATVVFAAAFIAIALLGGTTIDDIAIDRDLASGLRLAGALLGTALILGRAAGGQWNSWSQTWEDFLRLSWSVLPLTFVAGSVHRILRPTPARPRPDALVCGVVPASIFLVAAVIVLKLAPHGFEPSKW